MIKLLWLLSLHLLGCCGMVSASEIFFDVNKIIIGIEPLSATKAISILGSGKIHSLNENSQLLQDNFKPFLLRTIIQQSPYNSFTFDDSLDFHINLYSLIDKYQHPILISHIFIRSLPIDVSTEDILLRISQKGFQVRPQDFLSVKRDRWVNPSSIKPYAPIAWRSRFKYKLPNKAVYGIVSEGEK